jgi:ABC-type uncharacterized transport system auxiliary subunit
MNRRLLMLAAFLAGACSILPERRYAQKRDWPLVARRPASLPPRAGGGVLLVRSLSAAPGLEDRGLHALQPDGSMRVSYYEQWITPPIQGVEEALRQWLAASGLFAAVLAPGSRATADLVLEAELTALWTEPASRRAVARLAYALLDQRRGATAVLTQQTVAGVASLGAPDAPASVDAQQRALADAFGQIERSLAALV